jgi:uncharacterized membrane protein YdjX (TVP38/TMEM64 family)
MVVLIKALLWVGAAVALAIARVHPAVHHALLTLSSGLTAGHVRAYVASLGPAAPAMSVLAMVVMTFLPFPANPLVMANGAAFGAWEGLLVSIAGAVLSGCLAFGLGRSFGRSAARRFAPPAATEWVDRLVRDGTWVSVLALQFVPGIPFSLLNFLLGVTALSWTTFVITLAASILPADIIFVLLGRGVAERHSTLLWTLGALAFLTAGSVAVRRWFARTWPPAKEVVSEAPPEVTTVEGNGKGGH